MSRRPRRPDAISRRHKPMCCPFCEEKIPRPKKTGEDPLYRFDGGVCQCGAVFALDASGREAGDAFLHALGHACGDFGQVSTLYAGKDYQEKLIAYNARTHEEAKQQGRQRYGVTRLIFVRLLEEEPPSAGE